MSSFVLPSGEGHDVGDEGGEWGEGGDLLGLKVGPEHTEADDHADTGDVEKNFPEQATHGTVKYLAAKS